VGVMDPLSRDRNDKELQRELTSVERQIAWYAILGRDLTPEENSERQTLYKRQRAIIDEFLKSRDSKTDILGVLSKSHQTEDILGEVAGILGVGVEGIRPRIERLLGDKEMYETYVKRVQ
jgi:hypothetical protein